MAAFRIAFKCYSIPAGRYQSPVQLRHQSVRRQAVRGDQSPAELRDEPGARTGGQLPHPDGRPTHSDRRHPV